MIQSLPSLSAWNASKAFKFSLTERQYHHAQIWNAIFEAEPSVAADLNLNLALVGRDLQNLYKSKDINKAKRAYIVLVTGDMSGDIRYRYKDLRQLLKDHTFNEDTNEVMFTKSNIVLNIHDARYNDEFISIKPKKIRRLFVKRNKRLESACIFCHDPNYRLYTTGPNDVACIGGEPKLQNISNVCGLTLPQDPIRPQKPRFQQYFKNPRCGPIQPLSYKGNICPGWEWIA